MLLLERGQYRCSACCETKAISTLHLDKHLQSTARPYCKSCGPIVAWCIGKGMTHQQIKDLFRTGAVYILKPAMLDQRNQRQQNNQPVVPAQHAEECKQCTLCEQRKPPDDFLSKLPSQQYSSWACPNGRSLVESYCIECRFASFVTAALLSDCEHIGFSCSFLNFVARPAGTTLQSLAVHAPVAEDLGFSMHVKLKSVH